MAEHTDFFVGYLHTPLRLLRFLAGALALLLIGVDAVALIVYRAQETRASGDWGSDGEVAVEGVLLARPYPVVLVPATPDRPAHAVLLVSEGKHGAPVSVAALDGRRVTVYGYPLLRDTLTVLQLSRDVQRADASAAMPAAAELGPRTLVGEIVDSKCFLGAMVPGEGKVHEECAGLCLLGDVPALFVTRDAAQHVTYRLLADETGAAMPEATANRAGAAVTLSGKITRIGPLEIFSVPRASLE